jgi:hypothetical protein
VTRVVTRRVRRLAVVSWLGGAVSILPFATGWYDLSERATNLLLLGALASAFAFSLLIGASTRLQHALMRLAGPRDRPARALVLVAVVATAGLVAMLAAGRLVAST